MTHGGNLYSGFWDWFQFGATAPQENTQFQVGGNLGIAPAAGASLSTVGLIVLSSYVLGFIGFRWVSLGFTLWE